MANQNPFMMDRSSTFTGMLQPTFGQTQQKAPSQDVVNAWQSIIGNYNQNYDEARIANEARYQQALGTIGGYYDAAMGYNQRGYSQAVVKMNEISGQQAADIKSSFAEQNAKAQQNLARLGMSNTTISPTLAMGFERESQNSLNRLADLFSQQFAGLYERQGSSMANLKAQQGKETAGIIERRTDEYPDANMVAALLAGTASSYGTAGIDPMLQAFSRMR